ncbi:MAG: 6-phosphogluconate dehydrogenase [Clostridia bacterium]|nr:6-phosphogluconate dehydrogenase [Clostridia bacterium]
MQVGLIGLGKMGFNLALNMLEKGLQVVGYARTPATVARATEAGVTGVGGLTELVDRLKPPRVIWLMVPAGPGVDELIEGLAPLLAASDIIVDGGNSYYKDTLRRYGAMRNRGLHLADVGTSGGVEGARYGICAMVGAEKEVFDRLEPLLQAICVPGGYLHVGPCGSGHFVKMVHNGIEYGMLQALGEGFEILARGPFELSLKEIARLWRHGSVIRGWLMDLLEKALNKESKLESIKGIVHSSGEGLWTAMTALELGIPAPIIAGSVFMRYRSEQIESFAAKVVAALRYEFGGHEVERGSPHGAF